MPDNRDLLTRTFDPSGVGSGRADLSKIRNEDVMAALPMPAQQPQDASFQPAAAMQFAQQQPQQGMYQQAAMPMQQETQITQTVMSPQAKAAQAKADAVQAQAATQAQAAEAQEATIRAAAYDKIGKEVQDKMTDFQSAVDEYKRAEVVDPRKEWGTSQKIGAAISMALGAFASSFSGGRNYAADIIEGAVKRDLDLQEARINKLGADARQAEGALAQAYKRFGDIGTARTAVEVAALSRAGDDIMKLAQKSDNDKVKANAQIALAAIEQKKAALVNQASEMKVATIGKPMQKAEQKPLTEAQSKAFAYVQSMKQAAPTLAELESYGAEVSSGAAKILPKALQSEKRQRLDIASKQFAEGYIRFASGANVPEHEVEATLARAIPQAGDTPAALRDKAAYRMQLINSMEQVASGKADFSGFGVKDDTQKKKQQYNFR